MTDRRAYVMLLTDSLNNVRLAKEVGKQLKKHPLGLIYLDIKGFGTILQKHGQKACDRILQTAKQLILAFVKNGQCLAGSGHAQNSGRCVV